MTLPNYTQADQSADAAALHAAELALAVWEKYSRYFILLTNPQAHAYQRHLLVKRIELLERAAKDTTAHIDLQRAAKHLKLQQDLHEELNGITLEPIVPVVLGPQQQLF